MSISIKIALVGSSGTGKSTFINRHKTGEFIKFHNPNSESITTTLQFNTTRGLINLVVTEYPQDSEINLISTNNDAYLVLCDQTLASHKYGASILKKLIKTNKPAVVAINKRDVEQTKVSLKREIPHFSISSKSNYRYEKPLVGLMEKYCSFEIVLTEFAPRVPPEAVINF